MCKMHLLSAIIMTNTQGSKICHHHDVSLWREDYLRLIIFRNYKTQEHQTFPLTRQKNLYRAPSQEGRYHHRQQVWYQGGILDMEKSSKAQPRKSSRSPIISVQPSPHLFKQMLALFIFHEITFFPFEVPDSFPLLLFRMAYTLPLPGCLWASYSQEAPTHMKLNLCLFLLLLCSMLI